MENPSIGIAIPKSPDRPQQPDVEDLTSFCQDVEELGYQRIWTTEGWGSDSFVELSYIANNTKNIGIGTSVVNVFSRTPAVLAMASVTLAGISNDRFCLGLGAGHPYSVEDIHGMNWDKPVQRTLETIEIVKRYTGSYGEFPYEGEVFSIKGWDPFDIDLPIYNAALGKRNRILTGKLTDGWIPNCIPFSSLEEVFEPIARGARSEGRETEEIEVTPMVPTVICNDVNKAKEMLREDLVRYVGGNSDNAYKRALSTKYPKSAEKIAKAERAGDHEKAKRAVRDEILRDIGIAGPPEMAIKQLKSILNNPIIDSPIITIPSIMNDKNTALTIETLSPANI